MRPLRRRHSEDAPRWEDPEALPAFIEGFESAPFLVFP